MQSSPYAAITMSLKIFVTGFEMIRIVQWFANQVPLKSCAVAGINREHFVGTPAHATMIDDDIFSFKSSKSVITSTPIYHSCLALVPVTHAKAQIANNNIVSSKRNGIIC